jgi:hypothetical protein
MLFNFVKRPSANPDELSVYEWAIKALNSADGEGYMSISTSSSANEISVSNPVPVYLYIDIDTNSNALLTTNADDSYQVLYRYIDGTSLFRSYAKTNISNSNYAAIKLYGMVEYDNISSLVEDYSVGETYTVNHLGVVFRHDRDLWVADKEAEAQDYTVHLIVKDNVVLPDGLGSQSYINCEISSLTHLGGNYYQAYLTASPTLNDKVYTPKWLELDKTGSPIIESYYGHGVILKGTITEDLDELVTDDNKVYLLTASVEPNSSYKLKKYFNKTAQENTTEIKAPKRYDTSTEELTWAAYNSDWDWLTDVSSSSQNAPVLYVGGMIDVVNGKEFVYPVAISTNRDVTVSVDRVSDDEQAYLVGRDLYLPEGAELYTVGGVRVAADNLANGIYVVRYANGKAAKILVK